MTIFWIVAAWCLTGYLCVFAAGFIPHFEKVADFFIKTAMYTEMLGKTIGRKLKRTKHV